MYLRDMQSTYSIQDLSPHLFWDTDLNEVDFERSREQIIYKVLEYGELKDWKIIQAVYGLDTIRDVAVNLRTLDDVTLSFLVNLFKLEKSDFRCYKLRQSKKIFYEG